VHRPETTQPRGLQGDALRRGARACARRATSRGGALRDPADVCAPMQFFLRKDSIRAAPEARATGSRTLPTRAARAGRALDARRR